jgi:DNA-binding GntR family transcriptional regulator
VAVSIGAAPAVDPLAALGVDARQLDQRIYDALRERILTRELAPGTSLATRDLAARLGVSVTPVRDALRRLQADGLVQIRGRGETTVTRLGPEDIDDIFDLRLALEVHAVRAGIARLPQDELDRLRGLLAAAARTFRGDRYLDYPALIRLDGDYHRALVRGAGNARLTAVHESLGAHVQIARVYFTRERRPQGTHAEHLAIMDAYVRRDAAGAAAAVAAHIENTRKHILQLLETESESESESGSETGTETERVEGNGR